MKAWPQNNAPADFEEILEPLVGVVDDLVRQAGGYWPDKMITDIPYSGYDIGADTAANSLRASDKLRAENLREHGAIREVVAFILQIGIEQGRRIAISGDSMPASEVMDALNEYLGSMDIDVPPEQLTALLSSATAHLYSVGPPPKSQPARTLAEGIARRPSNYLELTPAEQWEVDRNLGILDMKG